jgi:hypothetical protein
MELRLLGIGIRKDNRMRKIIRNVKVTNKVKINVSDDGNNGFRGPTRERLNFTITIFNVEWIEGVK